ncbi:hypothetical protein PVAND_016946 [Polypedilum vanderplanki]|uniref:Uncharacterized protein n=1 Tax=Polypedilum vanderplanki TaxID=319348 RepID=A0A9J6BGW1_POLVA|nr:hypothetical protein PVAND_016946 [Polypedilum vanderplanki]
MSKEKTFCGMNIVSASYIIAIITFIYCAICAAIDFIQVITLIREEKAGHIRVEFSTTMYYIGALTVYVGHGLQTIGLCLARDCNDISNFFNTFNTISFMFSIFAIFDGFFYLGNTKLSLFFFFCATLNFYFLIGTCSLKKVLKEEIRAEEKQNENRTSQNEDQNAFFTNEFRHTQDGFNMKMNMNMQTFSNNFTVTVEK